ncbi:MAG: peptide chain release factor N(5)-glutamine methyltransferase [Pseudomonadota bacterium]
MPGNGSLEDLLRAGANNLAAAGIDNPRRDARLLAAQALGKSATDLVASRTDRVSRRDEARFLDLVSRRSNGEPISRICGRRGFWTLDLQITPSVLDPRSDSESLIETALQLVDGHARDVRVLDLGTGSGCLLLALLAEWPRATGIGVDLSHEALCVARANAEEHGLDGRARFFCGNWADAVATDFDLVISNPPYIESGAIGTLQREVAQFDPRLALDGGPDGLAAYRALIPDLPRLLRPGGVMVLEIGADQAPAVKSLIERSKTKNVTVRQDLAGRNRCVSAKKSLESMD